LSEFAVDEDKIESELKGNTLRVYWFMFKSGGDAVGVRELQKALGFSSPRLAAYHLEKLEELGLVKKERGEYCLVREVKVGVLRQFMRLGPLLLPRYIFYATMFTTFLTYVVVRFGEVSFYSVLALVLAFIGAGIFWYETVRLWRQKH
jgi:DNA-binding transcriptional ArsR family regulator